MFSGASTSASRDSSRRSSSRAGYYLIEAGHGIWSSLGLYDTPEQADESTKVAASWIRDEDLQTAFPNPPKITSGTVVTHSNGVTV